jgi:hypothetical protein
MESLVADTSAADPGFENKYSTIVQVPEWRVIFVEATKIVLTPMDANHWLSNVFVAEGRRRWYLWIKVIIRNSIYTTYTAQYDAEL